MSKLSYRNYSYEDIFVSHDGRRRGVSVFMNRKLQMLWIIVGSDFSNEEIYDSLLFDDFIRAIIKPSVDRMLGPAFQRDDSDTVHVTYDRAYYEGFCLGLSMPKSQRSA